MIVAKTERCNVRWLTLDDAAFILQLVNSPGWLENIGDRKVYTIEQAEQYMKDRILSDYEEKAYGMYGIELQTTHKLIGTTGLIDRPGLEDTDVGFAIMGEYMNQGYTYEATVPVIEQAKALNIKKLVVITLPSNIGSRKLLEKLGLTLVKEFYMEGDPELLCLYEVNLTA